MARVACMAESWGRGHLEAGSGVLEPAVCPGKPEVRAVDAGLSPNSEKGIFALGPRG